MLVIFHPHQTTDESQDRRRPSGEMPMFRQRSTRAFSCLLNPRLCTVVVFIVWNALGLQEFVDCEPALKFQRVKTLGLRL